MTKLLLLFCFSFANCLVFDCGFYTIAWYSSGNFYTCYSTVINSGDSLLLEDVKGEHKETLKNSDVEALKLNGQVLERLPSNLAEFFPHLRIIACLASKLTKISAEELEPFSNLEYLILPRNSFSQLDAGLFKFTPKLQGINFANNKLQSIGENLLVNLKALRFADFQLNTCINSYAETSRGLQQLNYELAAKCPVIADNSTDSTSLRCSLADEVDETQTKVTKVSKEFEALKFQFNLSSNNFQETNAGKNSRIVNLELTMRKFIQGFLN